MNRDFEIEELDEKIKFLFTLNLTGRAILTHCMKHEFCSKDVIKERVKIYKEKQKYKNGKPIR